MARELPVINFRYSMSPIMLESSRRDGTRAARRYRSTRAQKSMYPPWDRYAILQHMIDFCYPLTPMILEFSGVMARELPISILAIYGPLSSFVDAITPELLRRDGTRAAGI